MTVIFNDDNTELMMKFFTSRISTLIVLLALVAQVDAASRINTLERNLLFRYTHSSVAIRGYDTVAYFELGKAVKGSRVYQVTWNGAVWYFASAHHMHLFSQDPERYAPMYGGYCAFGVAEGYLAKIDGRQWTITDGKLYLSYNRRFRHSWNAAPDLNAQRADVKFEQLVRKL